MRNNMMVGFVLIALGVAALAYHGVITYTTREKVVDLGPLQVTGDKTHNIPLPPILGGLAIAAGAVVLFTGRKSA